MVIIPETEIGHDVLGPIRYDDGKPPENHAGKPSAAMWVARPNGWENDLEIHIACGLDSPDSNSIKKAVQVLSAQVSICRQARDESNQDVEIAWFDCTCSQVSVAFTDARDVYILWLATLDNGSKVLDMIEGKW